MNDYYVQDLELVDGAVYNFIEMPRDKHFGIGLTLTWAVLRARVEKRGEPDGTFGSMARLHILEPPDVKERYPNILERDLGGGMYVRVDDKNTPGPLTLDEYKILVREFLVVHAPNSWIIKIIDGEND